MPKSVKNQKRAIVILCAILMLMSAYLFGLVFFSAHFLPRTAIDGIDVSLMDLDKANEAIKDIKPQITIIQKTGNSGSLYKQTIALKDLGSDITYDASANLKSQNTLLWFASLFDQKDLGQNRIKGTASAEKIKELAEDLYCLKEEKIIKPVNAHYEIKDGDLVLIRSSDGSYIDKDTAIRAFYDHIDQLFIKADSLDLDLTGLYEKASIGDNDPSLDGKKAYIEKLINRKIELNVYDEKVEMSKEYICSLYDFTDSDPILNEDHLDDYLLKFAIENDGSSSFIDKQDLKEKLMKILPETTDESIEVNTIPGQPVRRVEVKINQQTLYYYEDDILTLKSPIVSGNKDLTDETPHGKFEVRRKVEDTKLRGRDYIEHVDYWVGFDETGGMYGLHDAQWRDEFGGDIWLYDPSRGCVNMPLNKIGLLFERLRLGDEISVMD